VEALFELSFDPFPSPAVPLPLVPIPAVPFPCAGSYPLRDWIPDDFGQSRLDRPQVWWLHIGSVLVSDAASWTAKAPATGCRYGDEV